MPFGSSDGPCHGRSRFPPQDCAAFHRALLIELLDERVASSRTRQNPRGAKRKMSNYPLRPRHPWPTRRPAIAVSIVGLIK